MGETAEDDAGGGDAFVDFGFDEVVEVVAGFEDAGLVLGLGEVVEGGLRGWNCLEKRMVVSGVVRGLRLGCNLTMSYQPGICIPKFCSAC